MFRGLQAGHRHPFAQRCPKAVRVVDKVTDALALRHEAVGIIAAGAAARPLDRPVGNEETEAVPAPPPGLADPAPLENDVVNTPGRELVTQRKPSLSSADYDCVNGRLHRRACSAPAFVRPAMSPQW